jgi:glycosyltransferase involved in cell wall biosynthesis
VIRAAQVCLLQTAIDAYRQEVVDLLYEVLGERLCVLTGEEYFDRTVRTRVRLAGRNRVVSNHFVFGRKLVWQRGVIADAVQADVLIAELNPRALSTWCALLLRRLLRRPTVLWGHAWPRRGADARSDMLRGLMRGCADVLVVYTQTEQRDLLRRYPYKRVVAAPNALYRASRSREIRETTTAGLTRFVFVGRLVSTKKPELALRAFASARLGDGVRLGFVGDGPLEGRLRDDAVELGVAAKVDMLGHVADEKRLAELYSGAIASLSPGYVGLSLIQSVWFGVPMLIARQEPHSPEIEAATGDNSLFLPSDDVGAWADGLRQMVEQRPRWARNRPGIAMAARRDYSVERMVSSLERSVEIAYGVRDG